MSSTETMKEYARLEWIDYCSVEVEKALLAGKMIIPVYHGRHGTAWIGQQLKHLRGLPILSKLGGFNAYDISDSLFLASVAVIDKHIQKDFPEHQRLQEQKHRQEEQQLATDKPSSNTQEQATKKNVSELNEYNSEPLLDDCCLS